jgi:hypothetical protein
MSRFWWGNIGESKGVTWMSWNRLGVTRRNGGMGFRDLESFNRALLAKQDWRLIKYPDSLVAKVLKEKYFPQGNFLEARLGNRPSYAWRSIFNTMGVLEDRVCWRVGNGERIQICKYRWIPSPHVILSHFAHQGLDMDARIPALINPTMGWWNSQLIQELFSSDEAAWIC